MKPIFLLGEARGENEERLNSSFVGPSGIELIRMLGESGLIKLSSIDRDYINRYYQTSDSSCIESIWSLHPEVYRTNVFQIHPLRNDLSFFCGPKSEAMIGRGPLLKSRTKFALDYRGPYVRAEFEPELDRLANELLTLDPNLIICLGNTALWAMVNGGGVSKLRGTTMASSHTVAGFKLLPTYHPAAVLRQWELRPTVIADLMKAERESHHANIIRPEREIWIEPSLDDIRRYINDFIHRGVLLSVDIETSGSRVTCIGFAPSPRTAIVIPFDDERSANGSYWPTLEAERECWKLVAGVLGDANLPKLFQNGAYDISFLYRAYGIKVRGASEDTMLLSHALQPESLKGLGYLGSIYSDEGAWKHMRKKDETIKRDA